MNRSGHTPDLQPQTRVEVDLEALRRNITALQGLTPDHTRLMAVVKANAYGHGVVPVAKTALDCGAAFLAVARISEAVELRDAGIFAPILLFGEVLPDQAAYLAAHEIRATVTGVDQAKALSERMAAEKRPLKIHIKMDTGMGRLGMVHPSLTEDTGNLSAVIEQICAIQALENLHAEGLYTHLAKADETDKTHARDQIRRFKDTTDELARMGARPEILHAANSAGVIDLPESHFDMVRPGIALYGLWPSHEVDKTRISLTPVMAIRSRIIQVKQVPKGFGVSYGMTHVTREPTCIATVPIGYADGYSRLLSNCGTMIVRGRKAPVVGRVCMDFTMIDVGRIKGVIPGDEVVILGRQGNEEVSADHIAGLTQTINYEVTAGLTGRMPYTHIPVRDLHDPYI
ncbi:MAG TPA: alanine racemase [Desulfobacteraceae bacterium]|nr:alanine racemase [Desulfobacteraceae bacterium]